jgi:hypothetical protein
MSGGRFPDFAHSSRIVGDSRAGIRQRTRVEEVGSKVSRLDHGGVNTQRRQFAMEGLGNTLDRKFG